MLKGHPKGLIVLALANMGERFGYYTMLAILTLFMQAKFGLSSAATSMIYGIFLAGVYFLPLLGGIIADKVLGYGKTILIGFIVMFGGYLLLSMPTDANMSGKLIMFAALALIAIGTGCFKGNLQALVGNLYDDPKYSRYRDIAFSIFYMFINIGAFFAPSMANSINNYFLKQDNYTYDASIPANYVQLNDFTALYDNNAKLDTTLRDSLQRDHDAALLNLKAAALAQTKQLDSSKYETFLSRHATASEKEPIIAQIQNTRLAQPNITDTTGKNTKLANGQVVPLTSLLAQWPSLDEGTQVRAWADNYVQNALSKSYNMAFGVACISLIVSFLIFIIWRGTWKSVDKTLKEQLAEAAKSGKQAEVVQLTPAQTRERLIALFLVFFVVIFFWMSFHQNGLTLTFFARDYTQSSVSGGGYMFFNLISLISIIVFAYGIYWATMGLFGGKKSTGKGLVTMLIGLAGIIAFYFLRAVDAENIKITPQIFQQFNPFFIVLLTPLSVALFTSLNRKGKEPSAPRKIGYGMVVAALGFVVILIASISNQLPSPSEIKGGVSDVLVSPNWLIGTYFTLTIAELLLSPMGLSFVAKVAPPQYKGMMQGGWLAATAIGNLLVGVMGSLWEKVSIYMFWGILIICCILSALFIFSVIKKLERATND